MTPHVVLVPLLAPSHMIPMTGIARLLLSRGAAVSFVTSPSNAAWLDGSIPPAVRLIVLPFPAQDFGLPEGCERLDMVTSKSMTGNFFRASATMREPLERYLRESYVPPSLIISDAVLPWTVRLAEALGVRRLVFHGYGCFAILCQRNIHEAKTHLSVASDSDPFVIPGLSDRIEVSRGQLPSAFSSSDALDEIRREIREGESAADGFVENTFFELEGSYVGAIEEATGKKVWTVGPVSFSDREPVNEAARKLVEWLDSKEKGSVVYVSFGSMARLPLCQLVEISLGLEASGQPFVWVIKTRGEEASRELEQWIEDEAFEERNKGKGLIIRGWAPQTLILSHPSIGGFVSHCGWNSTLESVFAGVPMVAWPLFAEQFLNEKLVVQILGIGVSVGVKFQTMWTEEEKVGVQVKGDVLARAIVSLTGADEEAEERRKRARSLSEKARRAAEEGGSSVTNLDLVLQTTTQ